MPFCKGSKWASERLLLHFNDRLYNLKSVCNRPVILIWIMSKKLSEDTLNAVEKRGGTNDLESKLDNNVFSKTESFGANHSSGQTRASNCTSHQGLYRGSCSTRGQHNEDTCFTSTQNFNGTPLYYEHRETNKPEFVINPVSMFRDSAQNTSQCLFSSNYLPVMRNNWYNQPFQPSTSLYRSFSDTAILQQSHSNRDNMHYHRNGMYRTGNRNSGLCKSQNAFKTIKSK